MCTSSITGSVCPTEHMKTLLLCPRHIIDQFSLQGVHLANACRWWLNEHVHSSPSYTVTASPSLLYEHELGTYTLSHFAKETNSLPLFIILLKDPIQRSISLYNHWSIQELKTGNGYSLPLENILELELNLLSLPYPKSLLSIIYNSILNRTNIKSLFEAEENLYNYMIKSLSYLSKTSTGRLNLRSFGLILDGFYLPQIIGWTRSNKINLKKRLLILKSEYFMENRIDCIKNVLFPFLFPNDEQDISSIVITKDTLPKIQNIKPNKLNISLLSPQLMKRIHQFYNSIYPIEEYLYELQLKNYAKIIPKLQKNTKGDIIKWWKDY